MARSDARQAKETLDEIDSQFDRLADWVTEHPFEVIVALGAVLLVAAIAGGFTAWERSRTLAASEAVAQVQADYLEALGATPGTEEVVEPANPKKAEEIRKTYTQRFLEVAKEHPGSAAAVSARMRAAELEQRSGDAKAALATLRAAVDGAPADSAIQALARVRLASALEDGGDAAGAAAEFERAGKIDFPGRATALAEAARCWADAGDVAHALATFDQAEAADPTSVPPYVRARLEELRAERS